MKNRIIKTVRKYYIKAKQYLCNHKYYDVKKYYNSDKKCFEYIMKCSKCKKKDIFIGK